MTAAAGQPGKYRGERAGLVGRAIARGRPCRRTVDLAAGSGSTVPPKRRYPMSEEVTEHAVMMSGGGMHVRNPEAEGIYPLDKWIGHQQRHGGRVYRRRVVVLEDWAEVEELS